MPEIRYREIYQQGTGQLLRREPYEVSDEELERERKLARKKELRGKFKEVHSAGTIPPPDLTTFILEICEYLDLEE